MAPLRDLILRFFIRKKIVELVVKTEEHICTQITKEKL